MKKNSCVFLLVYLLFFLNAVSKAASVAQVNIKFSANIINWSCTVSAGSQNIAVNLGSWNSNLFKGAGSKTSPVYFSINLIGCNSNFVTTTFSGEAESTNSNYLSLSGDSTAKNIAIQILNKDKILLPLNRESNYFSVDASGNAVLGFYANYITTAETVGPGTAKGDASFTINYY